MPKEIGLRERKKQQTRQVLIKSAYALFEERGYKNTSIDAIVRRANFAPRTFFLHFHSKEDLLFPAADQIQKSFIQAFKDRDGSVSALQTLQRWIVTASAHKEREGDNARLRRRIIESDVSLRARQKAYLSMIETLLAQEIALDLGMPKESSQPRLVAAAAVAVFATVDSLTGQDSTTEEAKNLIAMGTAFLENGAEVFAI